MVNEVKLIEINIDNINILQKFIDNAGNSTKFFRYFNSRPLKIISNHLVTVVVVIDGFPVGYGHLDEENGTVWLGIAVGENNKGKGIGKKIMKFLIEYADNSDFSEVFLSVDKNNTVALNLYEKHQFSVAKELATNSYIMKRNKNK